jgi:penicillin-binding protein 1C
VVAKAKTALAILSVLALLLTCATIFSLQDFSSQEAVLSPAKYNIYDRGGRLLSYTLEGRWNETQNVSLSAMPPFLVQAFICSEDRRFYEHSGVDWRARAQAFYSALRHFKVSRGASTISEQVVRMLHPRARSLWSRWLEGLEAASLEKLWGKNKILEFYLNQVPYARNRRGVGQAALTYFDRDLDTLNQKELLALVVLVRSPSRFDLKLETSAAKQRIAWLVSRMQALGVLSSAQAAQISAQELELKEQSLPYPVQHFVGYVNDLARNSGRSLRRVDTSLDLTLQQRLKDMLDQRLKDLNRRGVSDGAMLVVDNASGQILAWVNGGDFNAPQAGSQIDAILVARQPGSTLKPFVYALALDQGWNASTLIDDSPYAVGVGLGLHDFRNYSRTYYGPIRLREALGNSLNVPAVKAVRYVGKEKLYAALQDLGVKSFTKTPEFYGDGLALGNAEVSLYELVQAYHALARGGEAKPLTVFLDPESKALSAKRVLSSEASSIIANILADPMARRLEFGRDGMLRFPTETAVKTGTSSDYHDAWAVGFTRQYTAAVWLGNLDQRPMDKVSGAYGPALLLRAAFRELERSGEPKPLNLSKGLVRKDVCAISGELAGPGCPVLSELFVPGKIPQGVCSGDHKHTGQDQAPPELKITLPTPGLQVAFDPRLSPAVQALPFELEGLGAETSAVWFVDGAPVGLGKGRRGRFLWPLVSGTHEVWAEINSGAEIQVSDKIRFEVR